MIEVDVDMSEIDEALVRFGVLLEDKIMIAVKGSAALVAAEAKRTRSFKDQDGRLRASIRGSEARIVGDDIVADIVAGGMEVYYAPFIEFGTSHIRERRFMRDAYDAHADDIGIILNAAVEQATQEAGLA